MKTETIKWTKGKRPRAGMLDAGHKLVKVTEEAAQGLFTGWKTAIEKAHSKKLKAFMRNRVMNVTIAKTNDVPELRATLFVTWTRRHAGLPPHLNDYQVRLVINVLGGEAPASVLETWMTSLRAPLETLIAAVKAPPAERPDRGLNARR